MQGGSAWKQKQGWKPRLGALGASVHLETSGRLQHPLMTRKNSRSTHTGPSLSLARATSANPLQHGVQVENSEPSLSNRTKLDTSPGPLRAAQHKAFPEQSGQEEEEGRQSIRTWERPACRDSQSEGANPARHQDTKPGVSEEATRRKAGDAIHDARKNKVRRN